MNQWNSKIVLFLVVWHSVNVHSFGTEDGHEEGRIKCTNRFEYRHQIREQLGSCEEIIKSNPMCGKNFTVAYSLHPPYVFSEDGKVQGILPGT
jgi:hypothetical protein